MLIAASPRFRFFSIVGYMVILASTWEAALVTSIFALSNGGTGGVSDTQDWATDRASLFTS